ncbi:calcium-binding protein [Microvirga sp. BSC39]|uniref:calcium-binding protein n=1 Tax=Microvirga sp. BSC39 TaxID=1549810 RepID=UPI0009DE33E7|nr:calcium-binding protein [Microvirga sp. BSC39]
MSTRTTLKTGWSMPSIGQDQDTLWSKANALALPPIGTPGNDVLKGTNGMDGFYGQGGNDKIYGYGGRDALAGGAGNDTLYGGSGPDSFYFDTKLNAKTNVDKIMDFKAADDAIGLSRAVFSKIARGPLKETAFHLGTKAHDADDRIIYDKKTGSLYYDKDGVGGTAQIKFAILANKATIAHDDFAIA